MLKILPIFSWFLWSTGFMDVLILLSQKPSLPLCQFHFILCVGCFTLHGQNDQEASFLSPMNSKHNSYTTLDEYSVCLHYTDYNSMEEKKYIHTEYPWTPVFCFQCLRMWHWCKHSKHSGCNSAISVKQKEFKTNTGGKEPNIY